MERPWEFSDGTKCWAIGANRYIKVATDKIENELADIGQRVAKNPVTLFSLGYRPELDVTPELPAKEINKFQEILGILRWIVELGQVDVLFKVTTLSRFLVNPHEGHLDQGYCILAYQKDKQKGWMIMDPTYVKIDYSRFEQRYWTGFYPDAIEPVDEDDPKPLGRNVRMTCFVDADHAGDKITGRSYTGVILFLNNAPINWLCKRQSTIKTSTFGSEFLALRDATEMIVGL